MARRRYTPDTGTDPRTRALEDAGAAKVEALLAEASERALSQPGAKWTPATGWTDDALVDITVTVRVRINPNAAPGEDPTNLAQGIVDQALTLGGDDMERQAQTDADADPDSEARSGVITGWTIVSQKGA